MLSSLYFIHSHYVILARYTHTSERFLMASKVLLNATQRTSSSKLQIIYYVAILQNFILRFAWTLTLSVSYDVLRMNQAQKDTLLTVVAILEVYRLIFISAQLC